MLSTRAPPPNVRLTALITRGKAKAYAFTLRNYWRFFFKPELWMNKKGMNKWIKYILFKLWSVSPGHSVKGCAQSWHHSAAIAGCSFQAFVCPWKAVSFIQKQLKFFFSSPDETSSSAPTLPTFPNRETKKTLSAPQEVLAITHRGLLCVRDSSTLAKEKQTTSQDLF